MITRQSSMIPGTGVAAGYLRGLSVGHIFP